MTRPGTGVPRWWHTVGGRYAVSFPGWLIASVIGIGAAVLTVPGAGAAELLAWAGLASLASLAVGAIFAGAWLTYLAPSQSRPSRPVAALATYTVAGIVRSALISVGAARTGLLAHDDIPTRIVAGTVMLALTCTVAAVTVTYAREFSVTLAHLRREQRRQDVLHEQAQQLVETYRTDLLAVVQERVAGELQTLATSSSRSPQASAELRRIVDEVVRPISHEFARRRVNEDVLFGRVHSIPLDVRISPRAIAEASFTTSPFTPWLTTAVLSALLMTGLLRATDLLTAAVATAVSMSVVIAGLWLARQSITPRLPALPLDVRVVIVVAVWSVVALMQWQVQRSLPGLANLVDGIVGGLPAGLSVVGIDLFSMLVIAVAAGLTIVIRRVTDARADAVEATARATARLRQVAWAEQRELGRLIHSDVQARIISTAIRVSTDEQADVPALLRDLETDLRAFFDDPTASEWHKALTSMTAVWRLSTDFQVEIPDDVAVALDADWPAAAAVVEFISETTTNTIRHGDASVVRAWLTPGDGSLMVFVDSDGYLAEAITGEAGGDGLGTHTLNEMTLRWRCEPGGRGTLASAEIPLAATMPSLRG